MDTLLALSRGIDRFNRIFGLIANWLVLLAALVCAVDAFMRYSVTVSCGLGPRMGSSGGGLDWLFDVYKSNSNILRDLQLVMFAGMVMLGSAWTLKVNEHVRVDLAYTAVSDRARIWIDLTEHCCFSPRSAC